MDLISDRWYNRLKAKIAGDLKIRHRKEKTAMNVWFDNAGLHETFEEIDVSEYFEDDPNYQDKLGAYKGWRMRRS